MNVKESITLEQHSSLGNPITYSYKVIRAVNLTREMIGSTLEEHQVKRIIRERVNVTIQGRK